jgi:hypothetical protein
MARASAASRRLQPPLSEDLFHEWVSEWCGGIGPTSNPAEIVAHPAFRQIVAAGQDAVPLLLRELRKEPSLLVFALHEITGENPVRDRARGKIRELHRLGGGGYAGLVVA